MSQQTVQILNCEKPYTSRERAEGYVRSGRAIWDDPLTKLAIVLVDAAHLIRKAEERRGGSFNWYVGDSGGSKLVKSLTSRGTKPGVSGGTRVFKAYRAQAARKGDSN